MGSLPILLLAFWGAVWVFDLHGFGGNANHDVMWLDVARDERAGSDHCVVADFRTGQNGPVIGDTNAVSDLCARRLDLVDVVDVVVVRVDVGVVRD